jgi:DNA-binding XRE family transcriptional regulator
LYIKTLHPFGCKTPIICAFSVLSRKESRLTMMYQYRRIRDLREDEDLKQAYVAVKLHISQQTYQRYESGEREIPVHLLVELAELYDVSTDYLLGLTDHKRIF